MHSKTGSAKKMECAQVNAHPTTTNLLSLSLSVSVSSPASFSVAPLLIFYLY